MRVVGHRKPRAGLSPKFTPRFPPVIGGRRAQFVARGVACDVWLFCQKEAGHFGECQPPHETMSTLGVYPECRLASGAASVCAI